MAMQMSSSSRSHEEFVRADRKRSAPEDIDRSVGETKQPAIDASSSPFPVAKKSRKTAKYLQHKERCRIIKRIDRGETQASLAREFGVTRAAVNQLYKKRDKILSRGGPNCDLEGQSPIADTQVTPFPELRNQQAVHSGTTKLHLRNMEDRSETKVLLMKTMRDVQTSAGAYQRASARLTFILIEEAFARYDHYPGRSTIYPGHADFCGITLGDESDSFLKAFLQIDAYAQSGQIDVKMKRDDCTSWQLAYLDVPDHIRDLNVLLYSASGIGGAECKAIEALKSIGVQEHNISLVMIVCSTGGYKEITTRYPNVAVFTAAVEDKLALNRCPRSGRMFGHEL